MSTPWNGTRRNSLPGRPTAKGANSVIAIFDQRFEPNDLSIGLLATIVTFLLFANPSEVELAMQTACKIAGDEDTATGHFRDTFRRAYRAHKVRHGSHDCFASERTVAAAA